jgi:hypothetical protein
MGEAAVETLDQHVAVARGIGRFEERAMIKKAIAASLFFMLTLPAIAEAQECRLLCEPTLLVEPTITFEEDDTVFEMIFALDLATPLPRLGVSLEAVTKPFSDDNAVELESELNLFWLLSSQTGGWLSSHFDIVDKFSGAERSTDARAYTHKLNFELDTAFAAFQRLPENNWLRDVEIEGSLDYVATGLPSGANGFSFSLVFVVPIVKGR